MEVNNLKAYLANIGMSIQDFGVIIDCDGKYLSRIIHGKSYPSRRLAKDIRVATDGIVNLPTRPRNPDKKQQQPKPEACAV